MSRHRVVVLASANDQGTGADYQVLIASVTGTPVRTSAGVRIAADTSFAALPRKVGTVIVPGRPDWPSVRSGSPASVPAPSRWPRPACSTVAGRPRTGS